MECAAELSLRKKRKFYLKTNYPILSEIFKHIFIKYKSHCEIVGMHTIVTADQMNYILMLYIN